MMFYIHTGVARGTNPLGRGASSREDRVENDARTASGTRWRRQFDKIAGMSVHGQY